MEPKRGNLFEATLTRAYLGPDLSYVTFSDANMEEADLSGADLTGTDFTGSDLLDADMSGVLLKGTTMPDGSTCTFASRMSGSYEQPMIWNWMPCNGSWINRSGW